MSGEADASGGGASEEAGFPAGEIVLYLPNRVTLSYRTLAGPPREIRRRLPVGQITNIKRRAMPGELMLGTRKGLMSLRRGGSGWSIDRVDFTGHPVTMLLDDDGTGACYACLTLGHFGVKLHRSDDGGVHWTEAGVPVYPEGASLSAGNAPEGAPTTRPASLAEIWSLESGGTNGTPLLWAGTIPGGLFTSRDRGETWQLVESLWNRPERMEWFGGGKDDPGIHSIVVDPNDPAHVTIAISCGGVWETRDGGENWSLIGKGLRAAYMPPEMAQNQNIQDVHRLTASRANPDVMWAQHHNGIFHSTDGGQTFREIEEAGPSTFGFAACAHPLDPQTAWFVPAIKDEIRIPAEGRLVVTRTRDGGETFESLTRGLPQSHCYDLVYRHALDVASNGEWLAFGSTTGGLWISENGGDDWTCFSHTLPPIYTVRFAV